MSLSSIIIDRIRIRYAAVLFEVANLADWQGGVLSAVRIADAAEGDLID